EPVAFLNFVNSKIVNSTLDGSYNQTLIYPTQVFGSEEQSYGRTFNSTRSNVTITISIFNTTQYAYSNYNQTFNAFYQSSKATGNSYYTSTFEGASYLIQNIS